MIALTVIVFAFHDFLYDALSVTVYKERPLFEMHEHHDRGVDTVAENLLPPEALLANLKTQASDFVPREMMYMGPLSERAEVRIAGENLEHMVRGSDQGFAAMDPYTGELEGTEYLPGQEDPWTDIIISIFALHFGSYGGDFMRWVYVFMGLAGAFIFYSGNLLWVETRRRKQRRNGGPVEQKRNTRLMASATVGVCWGSVAGIALSMSAGKWLHGTMAADSLYLWAITWCFWRRSVGHSGVGLAGGGGTYCLRRAGLAHRATDRLVGLADSRRAGRANRPGPLAVDGRIGGRPVAAGDVTTYREAGFSWQY